MLSKSRVFHGEGVAYIKDRPKNELAHILLPERTRNIKGPYIHLLCSCRMGGYFKVLLYKLVGDSQNYILYIKWHNL